MTAGRFLHPALDALVAAALGLVVVAGAAFVWIGVPLLGLWLAGQITATPARFLLVALVGIPTAMVGFGWLLYRLNRVYEGLRAQERRAGDGHAPWSRWAEEVD